ncbi:MAG: hypothetical protein IJ632_04765 [Muribaculaceae bacterium]|nr:hypothetical protein [Muribaculaceae bacterium]
MSAFAIFVLVVTVLYAIYYSVIITQDVYGKKDAPEAKEEEIDVSQMNTDAEKPTTVSESGDGFRIGDGQDDDSSNSGLTFIDNEEDAERYQEKVKNEMRAATEVCADIAGILPDVEVDSTGAVEPEPFVDMLINQKPGGPKIFQTRTNA